MALSKRIIIHLVLLGILLMQDLWAFDNKKLFPELEKFSQLIEVVDQFYVEDPQEKKMMQGAMQGLLSALDPHSLYFTPEEFKDFNDDTKGQFSGVGIELAQKEGALTVVSTLQDSPAWSAGIRSGDKILSIENKSTKSMSLPEASSLLRGIAGKKVNLSLLRHGQVIPVTLTRAIIEFSAVKFERWEKGVLYIKLQVFQENVGREIKKIYLSQDTPENPVSALVLDLRDNPGGLLPEAVKICDLFLEKGRIVSVKGRKQDTEVYEAHSGGTLPNVPMALLINEGSASASEIVAGALQDLRRAKIIGNTSYGKGSVQTLIELPDGDAVKLTVAHYYTPLGRLIDGKGVVPDVEIKRSDIKKFKDQFKGNGKDPKVNPKSKTTNEENTTTQDLAERYIKEKTLAELGF